MDENKGETRSLNVIGIPAELFHKFKTKVVRRGVSIKMVVVDWMEKFVAVDNPGDDVKKKIDNPEEETKKVRKLVEEILTAREAQEALKNPGEEPVDESLEVHTVEKPDEIRTVKEPEKEPEKEPAAEKNPGPESELEKEPVDENNPEPEKKKKFNLGEFLGKILPPWF